MGFADNVVNGTYKKKKKSFADSVVDNTFESTLGKTQTQQVQTTKKDNKDKGFFDNWFKAGAFSDGYQFGDVTKTILGTGADVGLGVIEGIMSGGEGLGDFASYRTADVLDFFGNNAAANKLRENANINATNELMGVIKKKGKIERNSLLDKKADSIANAMGTILTMTATAGLGGAAGFGTAGQTALSMGSMGLSSAGSGESEALQSGATTDEARLYGAISGAGEVFSEMLFGGLGKGAKAIGISKGLTGADDMLAKSVSDKFKSRLAKNLSQYVIKSGAEGVEEVISGIIQAAGKKLTYMSEEDLGKLLQDEDLLDQFIVGTISSGISQSSGLVKSTAKGKDFLTGYSDNEQKIYNALLNERIEAEQSESKKPLTRKQINTIEEQLKQDFESGNVGTRKIEEVLGLGEIYGNLKNDAELSFARELTPEELNQVGEEAKEQYADLIKDDNIIRQNYYEDSLRSQNYTADISKYDDEFKDTVQRAIDSGILNNSTKTHQFVDLLAKISADKGVTFDFTNNDKLKESSLGIDGAKVNGYVNAKGDITLNINSNKALDSVVGHELTHVLEGSDLYQALSDSIKEYAESTGEYEKRLNELTELYENVEGADVQKELTADLVGDYIFTNQEFINHLTQNRNLFQKIYDEIKYLVKQVTAGSKEARQLNKAMKMFEKAYKDNSVSLAEQTKYSLTQDSNGRELSKKQQEYFKDSKARDENGNLEVVYHGTKAAGFMEFHTPDNVSFYSTDNGVANTYSGSTEKVDTQKLNTIQEAQEWLDNLDLGDLQIEKNNGRYDYEEEYVITEDGDVVNVFDDEESLLKNIKRAIQITRGNVDAGGIYEGYVNLTNPYIVEGENHNWNNVAKEQTKEIVDFYSNLTQEQKDAINSALGWDDWGIFKDEISRYYTGNYTGELPLYTDKTSYEYQMAEIGKKLHDLYTPNEPEGVITLKAMSDLQDIAYAGYTKESIDRYAYKQLSTNDIVKNVLEMNKNGSNYDGVMFKNIIDEGMFDSGREGRIVSNVYAAFNSNQFKAVDNTTPTSDPDIRYSLTKDNKGRELTEEQNNYFVNSKTRDNNGNLITYYNGGGEYTVFDKSKMSDASKWGKGIYLTEYRDIANMYGDNVKEVYVNIENPLSDRLKTISFEQYNNLSKALYDEEAYKEEYDMYSNDLDLLWDITNKGNWADYSQQLKEYTGKDGIIIDRGEPREDMVIAFDSSQVKNVDNLNPTNNEDINMSLSQQNEIAPTRKPGLTYGEDIALAPVQEQVSALQEDIAAIREDYRQQSEDIKNELRQLRAEREEMSRGIYENVPSINDIAPTQESSYYENTFALELSDDLLKKYKNYFKSEFGLKGKQLNEAMEGIKELSTNPNLTARDVYNYLKENYGKEEIRNYNYDIQEVKSELRNTAIGVDEQTKKDIASMYDTYGNFRKNNLGRLKLVEYNGKNGIDRIYQNLSEQYPHIFNEDEVSNTTDQLIQLAEVSKMDNYTSMFEDLPEEIIRNDADELYSMIRDYRNETAQRLAEEKLPDSYYENMTPAEEEIPYEMQLENNINRLQNQLDYLPRKENYDIVERQIAERINENPTINRNILDLINQENSRREGKKVELVKPVIAKDKSSIRSGIDTLKTMFINKNAEIDNLAKESGNKMIKIAGDMLNNYSAEASNDITVAQTDNYGNTIGKSVQELFESAKDSGLETAFNDYLINYSNIDRWHRGKGSQTPLDISERLVANYESKYPKFKKWAKDVWKYSENVRNNWLESGMITKNMYNLLSEAYPHYVPYISDTNNFDATMDKIRNLKARPIKKARGGATEIFPVEEALTRYTYAQKRALRQNELYKQIYNTLQTNPGQRGAEVGEGYFTGEEPNLYRDDSGNYLTAVIDGEERKVQISDDLYKSLSNDMENQIKDLEQRLSIITKPLQAVSNIRRKILTSWSPSFAIKNPVKDIQDALFNSKHTTDMVKNYIPGIRELITNSTNEVKQFKALYGEGNLMGAYANESGLYNPKNGNKNNKFLKRLSQVNEIMELAPRYAEFKASLQNGESVQEAMYNAREITTNFARGGVITKALNRNGFTFLNASVQGFDKFIRNFSGENGAKGIANSLLKAVILGVAPAVFNELAFGGGDDKDKEYEALPDYIKDNYYLFKNGDGQFIRLPKGRVLSVFGSAARRTIELAEGEQDAFEGYLNNVNNQIGINNPEENNVFAPFIQAFGSKNGTAWYGGDIVPSRLQNKPVDEQYDSSTDKMSIWLGQHLGVSPYKINYLIDQYSGGIGDIILPTITDEATSKGGLLAPVVDQFTADSTTDNKYVSDFYSKNDELKVIANGSKATDEDILRSQYMYNISSEMAKLYAERRNIQADNSLSKAEKYEKSQAIKKSINQLAKTGLNDYNNVEITGNYANVSDLGYYKNAKGKWTPIDQKDITATESLGLNNKEMNSYYTTKNDIYNIDQKYEPKLNKANEEEKAELNAQKKVDIINSIKKAKLPDTAKALLYDKKYASTETLDAVINCGIDFNSYLDLQAQNFTADKNIYGDTINGSKKNKVYNYINNMNLPYEKKIMLAKLEYKSDNTYNNEIISILNNDPTLDYQDVSEILKAMGFKVDDYGNITW